MKPRIRASSLVTRMRSIRVSMGAPCVFTVFYDRVPLIVDVHDPRFREPDESVEAEGSRHPSLPRSRPEYLG